MSTGHPDPFDVLDVEPRFDLDERQLQQLWLERSAAVHPDRFSDPLEQAEAAEQSAALNAAYRALNDPETRAMALLRRRTGQAALPETKLPPDLLMQMMEVREELEQAVAEEDQPTLQRLRTWASEERGRRLKAIAELFAGSAPETQSAAVQEQLAALRYVQRMLEQMPH